MIHSIINFLSLPCDIDIMELIVIIIIVYFFGLLRGHK